MGLLGIMFLLVPCAVFFVTAAMILARNMNVHELGDDIVMDKEAVFMV